VHIGSRSVLRTVLPDVDTFNKRKIWHRCRRRWTCSLVIKDRENEPVFEDELKLALCLQALLLQLNPGCRLLEALSFHAKYLSRNVLPTTKNFSYFLNRRRDDALYCWTGAKGLKLERWRTRRWRGHLAHRANLTDLLSQCFLSKLRLFFEF